MFEASGPVSANEDCFRAIFIARDGEDSLEVTLAERDTDASMRNRMRFNPAAIAAVGIGSKFVHDDEFESESDGETFVASHNCAR